MRAQAQSRATLRALSEMANRPTKEVEAPPRITRIERIIVQPREPASPDEWLARNMEREAYGEGLDA